MPGLPLEHRRRRNKRRIKPVAQSSQELRLCGWYIHRAIEQLTQQPDVSEVLLRWVGEYQKYLKIELPEEFENNYLPRGRMIPEKYTTHDFIDMCRKPLAKFRRKTRPVYQPLTKNLNLIGNELELDDKEQELLFLRMSCEYIPPLERLASELLSYFSSISKVIAFMFGLTKLEAHRLILPNETLAQCGIIQIDMRGHNFSQCIKVASAFSLALTRPYKSVEEISEVLFGKNCQSDLWKDDYDHISYDRDFVSNILAGAIKTNAKGINILLYGPSGTGKTELSKVIARMTNSYLFSIGETDDSGNEPTRTERLLLLKFAQKLLCKNKKTILLFDEMEDILSCGMGPQKGGTSKVFLNRLFEQNEVPTIWITNNIYRFDPAMLRRFTTAFEVGIPNISVRQNMWQAMLKNSDIDLTATEILTLARENKVAPAVLATAVGAVQLSGGGIEEVKHSITNIKKIMSGGYCKKTKPAETGSFNPDLVETNLCLSVLTDRLCHKDTSSAISLCLTGPAGTGKSLYARYLAEKMDMEVIHKRTSDLKSKWVGETERNIARAFEEAQRENAFLIFDEADSLLSDRRDATAPWQVSQVNEMLTWMECHELPFVCTTNLSERLDPASLRRFTFKLDFKQLSAERIKDAFRYFFGFDAPSILGSLDNLTPGDLAVVKRKADVMGVLHDADILCEYLQSESEAKGGLKYSIGF